jgi:hypothetical protein
MKTLQGGIHGVFEQEHPRILANENIPLIFWGRYTILAKESIEEKSLWICGRVLRISQHPTGHVEKLLITLARYQQLFHIC